MVFCSGVVTVLDRHVRAHITATTPATCVSIPFDFYLRNEGIAGGFGFLGLMDQILKKVYTRLEVVA